MPSQSFKRKWTDSDPREKVLSKKIKQELDEELKYEPEAQNISHPPQNQSLHARCENMSTRNSILNVSTHIDEYGRIWFENTSITTSYIRHSSRDQSSQAGSAQPVLNNNVQHNHQHQQNHGGRSFPWNNPADNLRYQPGTDESRGSSPEIKTESPSPEIKMESLSPEIKTESPPPPDIKSESPSPEIKLESPSPTQWGRLHNPSPSGRASQTDENGENGNYVPPRRETSSPSDVEQDIPQALPSSSSTLSASNSNDTLSDDQDPPTDTSTPQSSPSPHLTPPNIIEENIHAREREALEESRSPPSLWEMLLLAANIAREREIELGNMQRREVYGEHVVYHPRPIGRSGFYHPEALPERHILNREEVEVEDVGNGGDVEDAGGAETQNGDGQSVDLQENENRNTGEEQQNDQLPMPAAIPVPMPPVAPGFTRAEIAAAIRRMAFKRQQLEEKRREAEERLRIREAMSLGAMTLRRNIEQRCRHRVAIDPTTGRPKKSYLGRVEVQA